jgi:hypothetical protein
MGSRLVVRVALGATCLALGLLGCTSEDDADEGANGNPPAITGSDFEGLLLSIAYEDDCFVAVGLDERDAESSETGLRKVLILSSEDGRHWNRRAQREDGFLGSVAFGGGRWVAVGWSLSRDDDVYSQTVLTSSDARTWIRREPPEGLTLRQVVWTGTHFLVTGAESTGEEYVEMLWRSPDGLVWTPLAPPEGFGPLAVSPLGVATGGDGQMSFSRDSGSSWITTTLPEYARVDAMWAEGDGFGATASHRVCCFDEGQGVDIFYELRSGDGIEWRQWELPSVFPIIPSEILQGADVSIAVGGRLAVRAKGARDWTLVDLPYRGFTGVARGAGVFVAVGAGLLRWSEDGKAWHEVDSLE